MAGTLTGIVSSAGKKKSFWTTGAVIALLLAISAIVTYQMQGASYLTLGALAGFQVLKGNPESDEEVNFESFHDLD